MVSFQQSKQHAKSGLIDEARKAGMISAYLNFAAVVGPSLWPVFVPVSFCDTMVQCTGGTATTMIIITVNNRYGM